MLAGGLAVAGGGESEPAPATAAAAAPRPNIVLVTTDDQEAASLNPRVMRYVSRLLAAPGTTFTDAVVSGPLCCPSRAVSLTGQYGHNNGVEWNLPGYTDLRDKANTLPVWLKRAGYRTAHVGKYLNGYDDAAADTDDPGPGWDEWQTVLDPVSYYDYVLRVNGRAQHYGSREGHHLTRVINQIAGRFAEGQAPRAQPFFLQVDHLAPHGSGVKSPRCGNYATPDPDDVDAFRDEPLPQSTSFDEADVSDKPGFVRERPRIVAARAAEMRREHGCRLASLRGVDRGVARIHEALRRAGELDNTVFVFTSDNGWLAGQHRVPADKVLPYEESLRVPLVVKLPPRLQPAGGQPGRSGAAVANVDLVPTILALARAAPCRAAGDCRTLDGRSMLPLLQGRRGAWPANRGVLLELEVPNRRAAPFTPCDYEGVRAQGEVYVEHHYSTGRSGGPCQRVFERELYDLSSDPFQLANLAPAQRGTPAAAAQQRLSARLRELRNCAGIAGRDPRSGGRPHCE